MKNVVADYANFHLHAGIIGVMQMATGAMVDIILQITNVFLMMCVDQIQMLHAEEQVDLLCIKHQIDCAQLIHRVVVSIPVGYAFAAMQTQVAQRANMKMEAVILITALYAAQNNLIYYLENG